MAHGRPDWGLTSATAFTYPMTDLGELAVRLGSIDFFERRGDALCLDGFEEGVGQWNRAGYGTGAKVELSSYFPKSGAFCARLTAGSDGMREATIWRHMALPALLRLGFEFSFSLDTLTERLQARLFLYNGTESQNYQLRYHHVDEKLQVWDSDSTWKDVIATVALAPYLGLYHVIKVVIDPTVPCYERVLLDSDLIDLSGYHPVTAPGAAAPRLQVEAEHFSTPGNNAWSNIDNVIVTQDEP